MPSFTANQLGLSYPKVRNLYFKVVPIARTDSSTAKCVIPKDAVVVSVDVYQATAAVTGAASFNLGWSGATTALLNAFSMPTSSVGLVRAGAAVGTGVFTKQTVDRTVIATYSVGTSTSGGTGYVIIGYFVAGGQEQVDD